MTSHTTNEELKQAITRSQVYEWGFRGLLALLVSLLCYIGAGVMGDVKRLPIDLAEKIATVIDRLQKLESRVAQEEGSHVTVVDWSRDRTTIESRVSATEAKQAVLEAKLDSVSSDVKRVSTTTDRIELTLTGFQIDFNKLKK